MGMTIVEKTLASAAREETVSAGEVIFTKWNLALGNNLTIPAVQETYRKMDVQSLRTPEEMGIVSDHFHQPASEQEAQFSQNTIDFARDFNVDRFFNTSRSGVGYLQASEEGWVVPGDVILGTDSHTLALGALGALGIGVGATDLAIALAMGEMWIEVPESVKISFTGEVSPLMTGKDLGLALLKEIGTETAFNRVIEVGGETIKQLTMSDRFALTDMLSATDAVGVLLEADREALDFLSESASRESRFHFADDDAYYHDEINIDVESLEPQIQRVDSDGKVFGVSALTGKNIPIHTVVIGGCSGGLVEDLWKAAKVMKYRQVSGDLRLIVIPATPKTYQKMVNEGLASIFVELGGEIWPPGCGLCPDNHQIFGTPDDNILITSRGDISPANGDGRIYSAGVSVAAAAAIQGKLTDPRELISEAAPAESS